MSSNVIDITADLKVNAAIDKRAEMARELREFADMIEMDGGRCRVAVALFAEGPSGIGIRSMGFHDNGKATGFFEAWLRSNPL
jgi:hypothetical protein